MDVVEAYEARRTIPGVCTSGDIFMVYDDGSVDHLSRLGRDAERRFRLHRASLRPIIYNGPPRQTDDTALEVVK